MENTQSSPEKEPKGKIVTFYSYKGGVGRSMALANVAVLLAKMGKKVLVVDFDLEAPGLDRFFASQKIENSSNRIGVLGSMRDVADWISSVPREVESNRSESVYDIVELEGGHQIRVLNSGEHSSDYVDQVRGFSWSNFFQTDDGAVALETLRNIWREAFDFILIDSRTGITDIGGVCTVQLPDYLVLVFAANDQNLDGCKRVVEGIHKQRAAFAYDRERLQIIPLLSRFDGRAEKELANEWLEKAAKVMQPMLDDWLPKHTSALEYFDKTKLPHIPKYSFGEKLACLEERETDPDSLTYYYSAIARLIDGHLQRPERLLALTRKLDESEVESILKRAHENYENRATIAHIESLIDTFTGAAAAQAQPLREQIYRLTIDDPDIRDELETIAIHAERDDHRKNAIALLKELPCWTPQDTENLAAELERRKVNRAYKPKTFAKSIDLELAAAIHQVANAKNAQGRFHGILALGTYWSGDAHAKAVILRVAIGIPEQQIPPDENSGVRNYALRVLGESWRGDAEVKAALLRVAIGVPDQQTPPDQDGGVRKTAIVALRHGWSRDAEVKRALIRALIGVPESGIRPDADRDVRRVAVESLRHGWTGDAESKEAFLRVLIGAPEMGIRPDQDDIVLRWAFDALRGGWRRDPEVITRVQREVERLINTRGRHHLDTRWLMEGLDNLLGNEQLGGGQ